MQKSPEIGSPGFYLFRDTIFYTDSMGHQLPIGKFLSNSRGFQIHFYLLRCQMADVQLDFQRLLILRRYPFDHRLVQFLPVQKELRGWWFDDKWVKFSGTMMHAISIWKEELTVPPFHPNRVEVCDFHKKTESKYEKTLIANPLHIFQESSRNTRRKITDFSENGLFIWFSGNTLINGKGSLMGYFVSGIDYFTFYLTLTKPKDWKADKAIDLTINEVKKMIAAKLTLM